MNLSKRLVYVSFALLLFLAICLESRAETASLRVEGGQATVESNYFRVPKTTGTRVDFPEDRTKSYLRLDVRYRFSQNQTVRVLYAPFEIKASLPQSTDVRFQDQVFSADGNPLNVRYMLNSYRASYIYTWNVDGQFRPSLGFTGKIRDAAIELSKPGLSSERANVGFVPLIFLGMNWQISPLFDFDFELDGSAAPQGRAFDGHAEIGYQFFKEHGRLSLGYRVLDGGVKTDENENFALVRFAFLALNLRY